MKISGLPEKAVLFREGLEPDGDIGIVVSAEAFVFHGFYHGEPVGGLCALALELRNNSDEEIRRVVSLVLGTPVVVNLIGLLQNKLQLMEAPDESSRDPGGSSQEP